MQKEINEIIAILTRLQGPQDPMSGLPYSKNRNPRLASTLHRVRNAGADVEETPSLKALLGKASTEFMWGKPVWVSDNELKCLKSMVPVTVLKSTCNLVDDLHEQKRLREQITELQGQLELMRQTANAWRLAALEKGANHGH